MTRSVVFLASCLFAGASLAGPVQPAQTGVAGAVCLASPERALAWLDRAVSRARSLGVPARGVDALGRFLAAEVGANLLLVGDWKKVGLDARRPVCLAGPAPGFGRVVVIFGVSDAKRAVEMGRRVAALRDRSVGVPKSATHKGAKVFRFGSSKGEEVLVLGVDAGTGFLGLSHEDVAFFLEREVPDPASGWAFPDGDVVVSAHLDLRVLGTVTGDDDFMRMAETTTPEVRGHFVVSGQEVRVDLRGPAAGLLALVGGVLERTPPGTGRNALARLDARTSGFFQVRLPVRAVLDAMRTFQGRKGSAVLPAGWEDLVKALSGDVLVAASDGLAGLFLLAGVEDEEAARRGLAGVGPSLKTMGVSVTVEEVSDGMVFRFGGADSPVRLPVFAALRDGVLAVSLSPARLQAAIQAPESRYLDHLEHPLVREGLKSSAWLVGHGYEADSLGGLLAYAAIVREALAPEAAVWMDLFDGLALAADLAFDFGLVATLSSSEWSLRLVGRFLPADPASPDPRERRFAQAVRARMEGRLATAREAWLALAQGEGPHASKARRCLVQPEPAGDLLVGAVLAGALAAWSARSGDGPEAAAPDEGAGDLSPCQQYLLRSCLGQDPEGPSCRKARTFFEGDGPSAKDHEECLRLLGE